MAEDAAALSAQQPIELTPVQPSSPSELPVTQQQEDRSATEQQSDDCRLELPSAALPMEQGTDGPQSRAGDVEAVSVKQALQSELTPEKLEPLTQGEAKIPSETPVALEAVNSSAVPVGFRKGEVDTAPPFESVKEAVSLFGARVDWKSPLQTPSMERRIMSETDLHKVQEHLAYYKEQVALTQASTANVVLELQKTKEQIQALKRGPEDGHNMEHRAASPPVLKSGKEPNEADEDVEKFGVVVSESQLVRREIKSVKEELLALKDSKQAAVRESQEAMIALDSIVKRVEELIAEQASINEALEAAQAALIEAEEQVLLLRSDKEAETAGKLRDDSEVLSQVLQGKSTDVKELELKPEEASAAVAKLKEELAGLIEAEKKAALSATEAEVATEKLKLELEQAKSVEMEAVTELGRVAEELDKVVANVDKVKEEGASLSSALQVLKSEVESGHVELENMHEKEQTACATLASLQEELCKVRESLMSVQAGEAKAREAKETLPTAIKQAASEADEAKAAAEASKEEVRKARHETEQAKAATSTAVSRLQAALREQEAAQASESMALAEIKAITESETKVAVSESESEKGTGVTISLEEYSSLKQAAQEAEDVANKKVAAAVEQVEAAKSSQREAQGKLDVFIKEAEGSRENLQKAQKKADEAQEAKLAAEGELRRWRAEHEHRRKSVSTPLLGKISAASSPQLRVSNGEGIVKGVPHEKGLPVNEKKVAGLDSLAQVLSLKVPPPEKPAKFISMEKVTKETEKLKKKKTFLTRVASFVTGKRSRTLTK